MISRAGSRRPSPGTGSILAERVLVTGAAGFVGSQLVRRLVADGHRVVAAVRPGSDPARLADVIDEVELVHAELADERLPDLGPLDRVLHLAAAGVGDGATARGIVSTNVIGTLRVLQHARRSGAASFLYCGSCFEYGPGLHHRETDRLFPASAYAASKSSGWLLAQAFAHEHGLHVVGVRPFTVYGPGEPAFRLVPSVCAAAAAAGGVVELTAGEQTRDFVFVADAVEAIVRVGLSSEQQTFNICTGRSTSVRAVAQRIVELGGRDTDLRFGARPARAVEFATLSGDPSLLADRLGWTATTSLDDGLRQTLTWFEEHAVSAAGAV